MGRTRSSWRRSRSCRCGRTPAPPHAASIRCRVAGMLPPGSPATMIARTRDRPARSIPSRPATSAMCSAYVGVQQMTVTSFSSAICNRAVVESPPAGIASIPISTALPNAAQNPTNGPNENGNSTRSPAPYPRGGKDSPPSTANHASSRACPATASPARRCRWSGGTGSTGPAETSGSSRTAGAHAGPPPAPPRRKRQPIKGIRQRIERDPGQLVAIKRVGRPYLLEQGRQLSPLQRRQPGGSSVSSSGMKNRESGMGRAAGRLRGGPSAHITAGGERC